MKKIPETQTTTENSWQKRAEKAEAQVEILMHEIEYVKEQMRLMNAKRYGASSAVTFSLIESAKENELNPYEYLKYLLEELPKANMKDLDKFLPWSEFIPEHVKTPKRK